MEFVPLKRKDTGVHLVRHVQLAWTYIAKASVTYSIVLLIWIIVGQGPTALAVGAGGGCLDIFSLAYHFSFSFSLSLGDGPI